MFNKWITVFLQRVALLSLFSVSIESPRKQWHLILPPHSLLDEDDEKVEEETDADAEAKYISWLFLKKRR